MTTNTEINDTTDEFTSDLAQWTMTCKGCGGTSELQEMFWWGGFIGDGFNGHSMIFTCTTCEKSQLYELESSGFKGVFEPSALEMQELWRYDEDIVWVREGEREPSEYDLALKGFLIWTDYRRELEKNGWVDDPDFTKYIAAHAGKQAWDTMMAEIVDSEIERLHRTQPERESRARHTPEDRDDDNMPF
jgi:hypothetical protein